MSAEAGQNTLEFFLKLNVEAFKEGVRASIAEVGALSGGASKGAQEVGQLDTALGSTSKTGKELQGSLGEAEGAVQSLGDQARKTGEEFKKAASWRDNIDQLKAAIPALAASAALGGAALFDSINFSAAFAGVRKTVDGTEAQLAGIRREVLALSREIPLAATELAGIAAAGGQLGVAAGEIGKFTDVTAKMATAFDMLPEAAGDSIGKLLNVFETDVAGIERIGDAINQLGNTTAARERDIVEVLLRIGGSARQMGLAEEQAAALAAAMLSLGKSSEVSGTAINAFINRLMTAHEQGDDFQTALASIGLSADELAAQISANPQEAINNLLQSLSTLDGQDLSGVMTSLFGLEHQANLSALITSLKTYTNAQNEVADGSRYAGSMQREFATRTAETDKQAQLALNTLREIGIHIGTVFLPAINQGLQMLAGVGSAIAEVAGEHPRLSALFATVVTGVAAFGPLRLVIGLTRAAITAMAAEGVVAITGMVTKMGAAVAFLAANPLLLGIGVALGAAAVVYHEVGRSALDMSRDHAQAAAEMGKAADAANQKVEELKKLQQTLLNTKEGTEEHTAAEEELARVLPDANLKLGEQGRVLASLRKETDENNKKLSEYINLKEREARTQAALQLEQQAKAYYEAGRAVNDYSSDLREWYGINAEAQDFANKFWITLNRFTGTYDKNIQKGAEYRNNLNEQKEAFDNLLRTMARSGASVDQVSEMLNSIHLDPGTRNRIITDYRSMLGQLEREAKEANKEISDSAKASSKEEVEARKKAVEEMTKQYADHVKAIRRLQGQIADDERSLAAQLRDISREGMSEGDAYRDRIKEAKEYQRAAEEAARSAQEAFARGEVEVGRDTFKVAIDLAKQAKDAYAGLASEVKEGDQVIVAQQDGLRTKLQGVKQAGEQAIALQKRLQEAEIAAANELKKKAGGADLTEGLSAAEKQWVQSFQGMSDSGAKAVEVVNDEIFAITKTITVVEQDFRKKFFDASRYAVKVFDDAGREIVDSFKQKQVTMFTNTKASQQGFADGGTIPGHSPHERADNILIPSFRFTGGEHVQPVRRVIEYGRAVFEQFRHGRFPRELAQAGLQTNWRQAVLNLPSIRGLLEGAASALPLPVAAGDGGADAGKVVNINITMPSGDAYQLQADNATAARMERERERWFALRSSNKVKRSRYALTR